jgi:AbrB family looped-hinge helix DNA binding protein
LDAGIKPVFFRLTIKRPRVILYVILKVRDKIMPRVTQKGQVTIPRQIRLMLSINTGDEVIFEMDRDNVVLKKKIPADRHFEKYVGYLSHLKGITPEDILEQLRGS